LTTCTIRRAVPADAAGYIALIKGVLREQPAVDTPYAPDEFDPSEKAIADRIADAALSANSLFLVAEVDGEIVGALTCGGGTLEADRHVTELGVYVAKSWRDLGIGGALLHDAVGWARASGVVERVELEVFAENERAIHLYRKFGFEEEGRRHRAYIRGGAAVDMVMMALLTVTP
jgi:ribosomal protein S18 acetylase RimI-like enzyme